MSNPAAKPSRVASLVPAVCCAAVAVVLWQFFGNATRGYVNTSSMFWWWISQWLDPRAESEHGWLILAISGWLLWRNLHISDFGFRISDRANPQAAIRNPKSSALAAMVLGLGLHAVGFAAQQTRISIIAFLVFLWGVLRLAGGLRWGRAAMFPVGFMFFAIPINVLDTLGFWLRMGVIDASAWLADVAGIDVVRSGTQLLAPDGRYSYDVAAACSGVRSLTALAALSLLLGYLSFGTWWRRSLVLLLCFPLVYVGNVARIASIIFAAQLGGPIWGDRAHEVMGYGVFVIVLGGVLGAVTLLQRWWPELPEGRGQRAEGGGIQETGVRRQESGDRGTVDNGQSTVDGGGQPDGTSGPGLSPVTRLLSSGWPVAALVVGIAAAEAFFLHHLANSPERGSAGVLLATDGRDPVELPAFLGTDWIGRRTPITAIEREILPADTGFSRKIYVPLADAKREVLLSIVLSGRDRTSIHRPELCLVGQGWTIDAAGRHAFHYRGPLDGPGSFPATTLEIRREVPSPRGTVIVPQLAVYWFVDSNTIVATHWQRMLRDAWNRVTRARADRWAYILMQTDASDGTAAALARMQAVLDGTLHAFMRSDRGVVKP